jgi:hypothetical protein
LKTEDYRQQKIAEYDYKYSNPYHAASNMLVDSVIRPTKRAPADPDLRMLKNKERPAPTKRHGSIPYRRKSECWNSNFGSFYPSNRTSRKALPMDFDLTREHRDIQRPPESCPRRISQGGARMRRQREGPLRNNQEGSPARADRPFRARGLQRPGWAFEQALVLEEF